MNDDIYNQLDCNDVYYDLHNGRDQFLMADPMREPANNEALQRLQETMAAEIESMALNSQNTVVWNIDVLFWSLYGGVVLICLIAVIVLLCFYVADQEQHNRQTKHAKWIEQHSDDCWWQRQGWCYCRWWLP